MTKHHSKTIQIQRICQLNYLEQTNGLELKTLEPTKLGFQYLVVNLFEDGLWSHPFELINQKLATGYVNRVKLSKDQEQVKITIYFKGRPRLTFQGRRPRGLRPQVVLGRNQGRSPVVVHDKL